MSEYPWDIENLMLAQHDQPCDCAICDEIHFNRETRRQKRRTATDPDCLVRNANAAWERATGANYPAHAEAIIKGLQEKLKEQSAKCNIYNCMDRKDLKLRIEQLENMHKEIVKECISIIKDYDKEGDAEATLCGYVFASSVICAIKRKFGLEI